MSIVLEEAKETLFWLEILRDANFVSNDILEPIINETLEIVKIISKVRKNAGSN